MDYIKENLDAEDISDFIVFISSQYAGVDIIGLLKDETFNIPLGASLSGSLAAQAKEGVLKGINKAVLKKLFGGGGGLLDEAYTSIHSTIKTYGESTPFTISFAIDIIPDMYGNKSYKELLSQLTKLTAPRIGGGDAGYLYSYLYNPLSTSSFIKDYNSFDNDLICVSIGNWFKKCGLFCTTATVQQPTILDEDGIPSFITVNFTFEPYRMQTAEDIMKCFKF